MENHFIGLDIGKKCVDVAVPLGNEGFSCFRVNNTPEGYAKLQADLEKRKADLKKKKKTAAYEEQKAKHKYFSQFKQDFLIPLFLNSLNS